MTREVRSNSPRRAGESRGAEEYPFKPTTRSRSLIPRCDASHAPAVTWYQEFSASTSLRVPRKRWRGNLGHVFVRGNHGVVPGLLLVLLFRGCTFVWTDRHQTGRRCQVPEFASWYLFRVFTAMAVCTGQEVGHCRASQRSKRGNLEGRCCGNQHYKNERLARKICPWAPRSHQLQVSRR